MTAKVLSNRKLIGLQNRTFYTQQELAETTGIGIETAPYGLIHIGSVELVYITKRIDRNHKGIKYDIEDTCHLTSRKQKTNTADQKSKSPIALHQSLPSR